MAQLVETELQQHQALSEVSESKDSRQSPVVCYQKGWSKTS